MTRPRCPGCGTEVSYPVMVDGVPHCYTCGTGRQGIVPSWLSRAKKQRTGLAKDLSRVTA